MESIGRNGAGRRCRRNRRRPGRRIRNLLAVGRCIFGIDDMWDITRVIPAAAVTGQAAGEAASFCTDVRKLDAAALQAGLSGKNVPLYISDLDR